MQSKTALRLHFHSIVLFCAVAVHAAPIDRQALVTRHNVVLRQFDANNPLTVGNGEFAFTVDATGLQTFPEAFEKTMPLGTLSDWAGTRFQTRMAGVSTIFNSRNSPI